MLSDSQQIRFARQVLLPQVGEEGQLELQKSRVLIVGAGGLGVPVASYLAAAGIGHLGLADGDRIEASNLHRQVAYATVDIGEHKNIILKQQLLKNNPQADVQLYGHVDALTIDKILQSYDLIVDACDNFPTRFLVNEASVRYEKPLVSVALSRFDGQIMAFQGSAPCYRCLVPNIPNEYTSQGCIEGGILGPVAGLFGCWQALEVIKQLLKLEGRLRGQLLMVDLTNNRQQILNITPSARCPVCGEK